MTNYITVENY